jgi:hypothetical protein
MEVRVDLTNIPDNTVADGVYEVRIDKCEIVASKRTAGAQNLNVEMIVTSQGDFNNRKLFDNISLLPQVLWRVRDFVNAAGVFPGPEGFRTEDLIGRPLRATVVMEPRQDGAKNADGSPKMAAKVAGYAPIS